MVGFLQQNNLSTKFLKAPKQFCIWPLENGWLVADLSFLWVKLFCCKKPFNEELMTSPKERKLSSVSIVTILGKISKCKKWKEVKKTIYLSTQFLNNPFLGRTSFSKAKWEWVQRRKYRVISIICSNKWQFKSARTNFVVVPQK